MGAQKCLGFILRRLGKKKNGSGLHIEFPLGFTATLSFFFFFFYSLPLLFLLFLDFTSGILTHVCCTHTQEADEYRDGGGPALYFVLGVASSGLAPERRRKIEDTPRF